ncbi:hypothetical protein Tco_0952767 [Tanacetum coccineum]|uniref:Transposase n=1 Tax=Tanacetum coccineum TaxID=301880 RepID=A0ABQ5DXY1_9ASTR
MYAKKPPQKRTIKDNVKFRETTKMSHRHGERNENKKDLSQRQKNTGRSRFGALADMEGEMTENDMVDLRTQKPIEEAPNMVIDVEDANILKRFDIETYLDGDRAERLGNQIQYDGHARVDAEGHSGGIWLYWKKAVVNLDILFYHNQHITVRISRNDQEPWIFTAIYASPDITKRQDLWDNLSNLSGTLNEP